MNNFRHYSIAGAVALAIGSMSPAHAVIEGVAGEALLVPFVLYSGGTTGSAINTYISIIAPSEIGQDTVINDFTAPNTTAGGSYSLTTTGFQDRESVETNGDNLLGSPDTDLATKTGVRYHWFFFDVRSNHLLDRQGILTPDDVDVLDWAFIDTTLDGGNLENVPGYMIITTERARTGAAQANFAMFGDAAMVSAVTDWSARIPVIPMSDGVDSPGVGPRIGNELVWRTPSGVPKQASPLIAGMRMNNGDGDGIDDVAFDMLLSPRTDGSFGPDTLHVIWMDRNTGRDVFVDVYDSYENQCSSTIDVGVELNLIYIDSDVFQSRNLSERRETDNAVVPPRNLCHPSFLLDDSDPPPGGVQAYPGFIVYNMREVGDTAGAATVDAAAVAFSLRFNGSILANSISTTVTTTTGGLLSWSYSASSMNTALAHERGKFPSP